MYFYACSPPDLMPITAMTPVLKWCPSSLLQHLCKDRHIPKPQPRFISMLLTQGRLAIASTVNRNVTFLTTTICSCGKAVIPLLLTDALIPRRRRRGGRTREAARAWFSSSVRGVAVTLRRDCAYVRQRSVISLAGHFEVHRGSIDLMTRRQLTARMLSSPWQRSVAGSPSGDFLLFACSTLRVRWATHMMRPNGG